jgi:homoserine kinase
MDKKRIHITAPASTANLGPGFDCLGLSLALYHTLKVSELDGVGLEIQASGEGAETVTLDEDNMVYQAMKQIFVVADYRPGRLRLESHNEIPLASGLGSSAAAYVAGLTAGMLISGWGPDRVRLIEMGVEKEGHADNVVPCVLGGFTVAGTTGGQIDYLRLEPPESLQAVVVVPDFTLPTKQARSVLPQEVPFRDAVLNQGRLGLLIAAVASDRLELLRTAMEDVLHQPYRAELVPGLEEVRQAALEAGALGAALSGAGPTILALVRPEKTTVGQAMQEAWSRRGIESRSMVLQVDRTGLRAEMEEGKSYA